MEDVSSVVSALKVRHSSSLFSEQVPVLGLCLPPSLSSVSPFRFLSLTDAQVYTHTHVHTHTRAHTPQTHRVSSVLQLPGLSSLLAPGFSVFNPTKCLKPSSPLDREPLTDRSASVASSRSPAQCLTHQGHSECKSSSRWFAFLWDGLFLRRVGKVLWRLQDTQDHRRGPRSTCCSRQLLRGPDSCPPLPLHLGIRMSIRTLLSERRKNPSRHCLRPITATWAKGELTYHRGPWSQGPSRPPGAATHSTPTLRGPSLGLLSPAGSRRSSWPGPRHQVHGAGHSGTPGIGAPSPACGPGGLAPDSADGRTSASGPASGCSGSGSWQGSEAGQPPQPKPRISACAACSIQNMK